MERKTTWSHPSRDRLHSILSRALPAFSPSVRPEPSHAVTAASWRPGFGWGVFLPTFSLFVTTHLILHALDALLEIKSADGR